MKKNTTLLFLAMAAMSGTAIAQPVINTGMTSFPVGTVDSAYGASPTVMPGAGGANVNWDMSTNTTVFAAKLTIVTPASTPYAATFPTATFAVKIEGTTTSYNYDRESAAGVENVAITYAGTGTGTDFSPNLRMSVPFPFHYLDSKSDTFQTTAGSPDTVRLTYDGYGTLKTPFNTYPNVIRIKEEYATKYAYSWYTVSPFALVMSYSSSGNNYVIVTTAVVPTGVSNTQAPAEAVIYPNPTSGNATLRTNVPGGYNNASVTITDMAGRTVKQIPVTAAETTIHTEGLTPGLYFYTVHNDGARIAGGKLVIN